MKRLFAFLSVTLLCACADTGTDMTIDPKTGKTPPPRLVSAHEAIGSAKLATIDPHTMSYAEIENVLPGGPFCVFSYTGEGGPILAVAAAGRRPMP